MPEVVSHLIVRRARLWLARHLPSSYLTFLLQSRNVAELLTAFSFPCAPGQERFRSMVSDNRSSLSIRLPNLLNRLPFIIAARMPP